MLEVLNGKAEYSGHLYCSIDTPERVKSGLLFNVTHFKHMECLCCRIATDEKCQIQHLFSQIYFYAFVEKWTEQSCLTNYCALIFSFTMLRMTVHMSGNPVCTHPGCFFS